MISCDTEDWSNDAENQLYIMNMRIIKYHGITIIDSTIYMCDRHHQEQQILYFYLFYHVTNLHHVTGRDWRARTEGRQR